MSPRSTNATPELSDHVSPFDFGVPIHRTSGPTKRLPFAVLSVNDLRVDAREMERCR